MKEKQKNRYVESATRRMIEDEIRRRKEAKNSIVANRRDRNRRNKNHDPDHQVSPQKLTCFTCKDRLGCPYVDDPYNTSGDCLASK